ncbi:NIPA-like protein 2 isoform X2 [Diceros bicornis minor]|uniref:NIPA-like protein 2 isoform X2 n=1 Tax=Diceros bicornis minor TaxID=77932 RepID=UPI0026F06C71|nr:NIPA-like protein 2 isoform X2 [Diceros bicornis minor]
MAALAPGGPGDAASAALDELSRNFTYGALGFGNGSLSGAWYRRNQIHLLGVLLAILGNLVISISLNIQKYSHLQSAHQEHPRLYFKSVLWWAGVVLMAVGETGNFAAYGFAPITLIAPLGCMSVTGSAIISVLFLKENLRASDLLGMTLAFAGTYLLVNFAPNITQALSARTVQYYFVGWQFLVYVILEILIFCILLYFHKRKGMKHIVILLTLVALLASLTVISVKAVSGMITFSVTDKLQLTYPIFYIMFIIMIASCVFQVKFLNQAMKLYNTTTVVPINHIFFTTSAIIAGVFCHSLVCFWSQEIEKRNICHSLTLILEIFLGNKCWTKYNQIQMAYPMELCLMEVTQQRAKVQRRKRSKMPRGMAVGLLFDTTFLKNCTCSICVSSYFMLTCARISFSHLPHLRFYGQSGPS